MYSSTTPTRRCLSSATCLLQETVVEDAESEEALAIAGPADEGPVALVLKRARFSHRVPGEAAGDTACLADLADFLPKEEAYEMLCSAALRDLMQHHRPITVPPFSMYS